MWTASTQSMWCNFIYFSSRGDFCLWISASGNGLDTEIQCHFEKGREREGETDRHRERERGGGRLPVHSVFYFPSPLPPLPVFCFWPSYLISVWDQQHSQIVTFVRVSPDLASPNVRRYANVINAYWISIHLTYICDLKTWAVVINIDTTEQVNTPLKNYTRLTNMTV